MESGEQTIIRPIRAVDSLESLTDLLHRAYAGLAKIGLRYLATHQSVDETRRRISGGTCYVAEVNGQIVGTITWRRGRKRDGPPAIYSRTDVAIFGQFGVEPVFQRQGIGRLLLDHVENEARREGCELLALDTAEQATHLIAWYEKLGFRFIEYAQWDVTNYRSVIMSKPLK